MLEQDLIKRGIQHIKKEDSILFSVADIKEKTTDIFVSGKEIIDIDSKAYILSKNLRYKVEFDYIMEKTLNK